MSQTLTLERFERTITEHLGKLDVDHHQPITAVTEVITCVNDHVVDGLTKLETLLTLS